jgi:hypothetical protein
METDGLLNAPAAVPPRKEISACWIKGWVDPRECTDVWQPQPNTTPYLFGLDFALGHVYIEKRLVHNKKLLKLLLRVFKHAFLCYTTVAVL